MRKLAAIALAILTLPTAMYAASPVETTCSSDWGSVRAVIGERFVLRCAGSHPASISGRGS